MAVRVEKLEALLTGNVKLEDRRLLERDGAALVGNLVSVYNGGRRGRVSSSFSAELVMLMPDYKKCVFRNCRS